MADTRKGLTERWYADLENLTTKIRADTLAEVRAAVDYGDNDARLTVRTILAILDRLATEGEG